MAVEFHGHPKSGPCLQPLGISATSRIPHSCQTDLLFGPFLLQKILPHPLRSGHRAHPRHPMSRLQKTIVVQVRMSSAVDCGRSKNSIGITMMSSVFHSIQVCSATASCGWQALSPPCPSSKWGSPTCEGSVKRKTHAQKNSL